MSDEKIRIFNEFTLDLARGCLMRAGQPVHLRPQSFEVLRYLAENKGRLISKDQFIEELWQGRAVTDGALGKCIEEVREALGEEARLYIRNVRGRGYIFESGSDDQPLVGKHQEWSEQVDLVRVVVEDQETDSEEGGTVLVPARKIGKSKAIGFSIAGLLVTGVVLGAALYFSASGPVAPERSRVRSLAVLPFKSLSGETGDEYLGLGLADTLITRLSGMRHVAVRPSSSVLRYAQTSKDTIEIGRELGVESVLEGSIQVSGGRIRATVQLVSVEDQVPLWADKFDQQFTDIFAVEDSIAERVAERLAREMSTEEREALAKHHTEDAEAHLLYLKGRYRLEKKTADGTRKALEFFEQAIERDPSYALAYTGIAQCYISLSVTGDMLPSEAFPLVKQKAEKALEIDPLLAEAHTSLGIEKFWHAWDWAGAERDFVRAIEINPNNALAHQMYAHLLSNSGRHQEALAESSRSAELNPLSLISNALRGQILFFAGQYDDAIAQMQKTIDVEPTFWIAHLVLGKVYERKKMYAQALAEFDKAGELSGGAPEAKSLLGYTYAVSGRRKEARILLDELKVMSTRQYVAPKHIALIYAGLQERDKVFEWLERAYENRDISLTFIKVEPRWNEYRSDPRFQSLLERVGLALRSSLSPVNPVTSTRHRLQASISER